MRSSRSLTRAEALGASLGLFLLPACSSLGGNALPLEGLGRHPARGHVTTRPTLRFPAARPDGTFPSLELSSAIEPQSYDGEEMTYEGWTGIAYPNENYCEIYDNNGNLVGQISYSVSNGVCTAIGVGPNETTTVTTPSLNAVMGAGGAAIGSVSGTFDDSSSTTNASDSISGVTLGQSVNSSGYNTMAPSDSLPALSFQLPVWHGGGGNGCGLHGCPQSVHEPAVRTMSAGMSCAGAILAALLIASVIGSILGEGLAGACGEPAAPIACPIAGVIASGIIERLLNYLEQMIAGACTQ
ncbi:MAG: hypothetical protein ACYDCA_01095 [Candidatus Tyrphobacter sp.]